MLSIPGYRKSFIDKCVENLKRRVSEPVDDGLASVYCNCAANVMEKRKITIARFEELADPTSFLYNEIAFSCGSPYLKSSEVAPKWSPADSIDIIGPVSIDSVQMISVMGLHKIRITIGGVTKIWLL